MYGNLFDGATSKGNTYTNDFMIPHNLPHAVYYKCYNHEWEHNSKHDVDDEHVFRLVLLVLFLFCGRNGKIRESCWKLMAWPSLTSHFSASSSHRNRQFTLPLHSKPFSMHVWSSQSYSSASHSPVVAGCLRENNKNGRDKAPKNSRKSWAAKNWIPTFRTFIPKSCV